MSDSHGGREEQTYGYGYPGYSDPAYASQAPYGPTYQPPGSAPTEHLPQHSPYGYDPYATGQYGGQHPQSEPPPEEPKSPRWLWVLAAVSVIAVIGLVIALVIVNSSRQETVVAPLPSRPEPSLSTTTPRTTTSRTPLPPVVPVPTSPRTPTTTDSTAPGATQTVVYQVSGDGRAINITYVDAGGVLQTEFNVMLPWRKEVQLTAPANASASISIINVGREVNCSITIDGSVVQQRSGAGLTVCTAIG
jgi:hypothetical protein